MSMGVGKESDIKGMDQNSRVPAKKLEGPVNVLLNSLKTSYINTNQGWEDACPSETFRSIYSSQVLMGNSRKNRVAKTTKACSFRLGSWKFGSCSSPWLQSLHFSWNQLAHLEPCQDGCAWFQVPNLPWYCPIALIHSISTPEGSSPKKKLDRKMPQIFLMSLPEIWERQVPLKSPLLDQISLQNFHGFHLKGSPSPCPSPTPLPSTTMHRSESALSGTACLGSVAQGLAPDPRG